MQSPWFADEMELQYMLPTARAGGLHLWSAQLAGDGVCGLGGHLGLRLRAEDMARVMHQRYAEDPLVRDLEPPQRIELPAGPAYLIRSTKDHDPDVPVAAFSSMYLLAADEIALTMLCATLDAHPDDDWLSIAETIEFLPAEEEPAASLAP